MSTQVEDVKAVVERRFGRAMKAVLVKVDLIDDSTAHQEVRKSVLDEFNELSHLVSHMLGSVTCDHAPLNDYYLELLESIDRRLPDAVN